MHQAYCILLNPSVFSDVHVALNLVINMDLW